MFYRTQKYIFKGLHKYKKEKKTEIVKLIKKGVIYFGTGGARGFDTIAAETIIELKKKYPHIKLILVLPCKNQTIGWQNKDKYKYNTIIKNSDKIKILSEEYYRGCMQVRNRYLVDNSQYCICYKRKETGGTAYTEKYAKKKILQVIYL